MRLGEKLVHDQLISLPQLEMALRAQVIYGGRLGTNLVELEFLELDALTRVLAELRGVPAALESNFEGVDPSTVALVPARLAEKHHAIPLALSRLSGRQLVVAFVDPTRHAAIDEIGFLTGSRIMPCVAPELRILRYLEKLYGIPRKSRYLRIDRDRSLRGGDGGAVDLVAAIGGGAAPSDADSSSPGSSPKTRWNEPTPRDANAARASRRESALGVERRRYATRGEGAESRSVPDLDRDPSLAHGGASAPHSVGHIGPARVVGERLPRDTLPEITAVPSSPDPVTEPEPLPITVPSDASFRPALSVKEALDRIEAAASRDDVGDAIVDHLRSRYGCGILFIARDGVALGWKGFAPHSPADTIETLALPLTSPSMLRLAYEGRAIYRGLPPPDGAAIQHRLWKSLRVPPPPEVLVAPIVLKDRVVSIIYCHPLPSTPLADTSTHELASLCSSSATAFARLIQRSKGHSPA